MKKISAIAIAILMMISVSALAEETPAQKQEDSVRSCAMSAKDSADHEGCCCCCDAHDSEKSESGGSCSLDHEAGGCAHHSREKSERKAEQSKKTS